MKVAILLKKGRDKWLEKTMDFNDMNHLDNYLRKMATYGYKDMGCNIVEEDTNQTNPQSK